MTTRTAILLLSAAMVSVVSAYMGAMCERQRYEPVAGLTALCRSTTEAQARALESCTETLCNLAAGTLLEWDAAVYCEARR